MLLRMLAKATNFDEKISKWANRYYDFKAGYGHFPRSISMNNKPYERKLSLNAKSWQEKISKKRPSKKGITTLGSHYINHGSHKQHSYFRIPNMCKLKTQSL